MATTLVNRQLLAVLVGTIVVLSVFPGVATAQSGVGGTVVVESGETVSQVSGAYGTIVIEGTVTGDVSGVAGDIVVREGGVIEGNLDAAAGSIRISGTIRGDLSSGAGSLYLSETGLVEGRVDVGAGDVRIDGTVQGDANIGAETIRLGEAASIGGSLTYDGSLEGNRDAVAGDITRDRSLGPSTITDFQPVASWVFSVNAFVLNLALGALLLGLFPEFSDRVSERVRANPGKSALAGLGVTVAVPVLLVAVAITVVGIPLSIVGLLSFLIVAWIGLVYGRFAVGSWLLSLVDVDNRWAALLVGLVVGAVLWWLPIVGSFLNLVIFLLGLGALVLGLVTRRRRLSASEGTTEQAVVD